MSDEKARSPKKALRTAGRCRRLMRQVKPNGSGKGRPTRTMAAASSVSSTGLLYGRCSRPSPPATVRVRCG
jgi:hypothetical protein